MRPFIGVTILLLTLTPCGYSQVERVRIGLHGTAAFGAIGRTGASGGERGDLLLLGCEADAGEEIIVSAALYYQATKKDAEGNVVGTGEWKGVPVARGAPIEYQSKTLNCASLSTKWRNRSSIPTTTTMQLFIPYSVLGLPAGTYKVTYRIRAWANQELVDDFPTDIRRYVRSTGSTWYERYYKCGAPLGPDLCQFRLLGTNDPQNEIYNGEEIISE